MAGLTKLIECDNASQAYDKFIEIFTDNDMLDKCTPLKWKW